MSRRWWGKSSLFSRAVSALTSSIPKTRARLLPMTGVFSACWCNRSPSGWCPWQYLASNEAQGIFGDHVMNRESARTLWLEDLTPGQTFRFGDYAVTKEEVIEFASRYDPQPFHVDEAAAAANPLFGRLCASGMHTMAMAHLLQMRGFSGIGLHPLAGVGMDELRLHRPVFPGDTLHIEVEITETRELRSRTDRGLLNYLTRVINQNDETVMNYRSSLFMGRRPQQR